MAVTRAWHLASRPSGMPEPSDFELREAPLPDPGEGMVRVENQWLSVDPYMRSRMNETKSYVASFQVGQPMDGGAVGTVVESRSPLLQPGDKVLHMLGWREGAVADASKFFKLPELGVPDEQWLGNLGLTGG